VFSTQLKSKLQGAESVTVLTGAGISAESGVPTFRGTDGIWKKFKPEDLANFDSFIRNPQLVWEWYKYRKQLIGSIQPNAGHIALAEMERRFPQFAIITQSIDNRHQRAGSRSIYELHGNVERNYCIGCGKSFTDAEIMRMDKAPRCTSCGDLVRPDVVWFGEQLPIDPWEKSASAAERAEIFFSIGTSAVVYPAASLPLSAKRAGAYLVDINVERTERSPWAEEVLLGRSGDILPMLLELCRSNRLSEHS